MSLKIIGAARRYVSSSINVVLMLKGNLFLAILLVISVNVKAQVLQPDTISKGKFANHTLVALSVPAICITYGLAAQEYKAFKRVDLNVRADLQEDYPNFQNQLDNSLQYMPIVSVYALGLSGLRSKNNLVDKTAMFLISNTIMSMSVDFIKTQSHKLRPDGSDYRAFPSGHTATAFAAAEFMAQEYKGVSPWMGYAGYAAAAATGSLRMLNNKHWFSDVVTGAGVGMLSTKLAYLVYPAAKNLLSRKQTSKITFLPVYFGGQMSCSLVANLD